MEERGTPRQGSYLVSHVSGEPHSHWARSEEPVRGREEEASERLWK